MKKDIHPKVHEVTAHCVCGNTFTTTSTEEDISVDICSKCHPFFTGQQKFVDTAGRIERFQARYEAVKKGKKKEAKPATSSVKEPKEEKEAPKKVAPKKTAPKKEAPKKEEKKEK